MIRKILIICANFMYMFFKLLPVKNRITMISRQSDKETVDFRLLREEIERRDSDIQVCVLCHKLEGRDQAKFIDKVKYIFHCVKQMYYIATSKVVILDSYCILISILKHRKGLKVIQMWHSMGTMKKFGYQILGKTEGSNKKLAKDMKMHKNYDYVFASGRAYASYLEEGFACGMDKIRIYSLPRVDLLTDKKYQQETREKIINRYPKLKDKKNIVYCPTFRKDEHNFESNLQKLIDNMKFDSYNLILKLHPLSKVKVVSNDNIINDTEFSTMDMLSVADYVISDYSCIIYEAAILDIPLYFFAFDFKKYNETRGITFNYKKEVPGIVSDDAKIIISAIQNIKYDYNKLKRFREKYVENIENCTGKIVDFIMEL